MLVYFPDNQLEILDYNRLVADLNGLDTGEFLQELAACFIVEKTGSIIYYSLVQLTPREFADQFQLFNP